MKQKRFFRRVLCLALCLSLLELTGCAAPAQTPTVSATLPPAAQLYEAPVGDEGMAYTATIALYLPSLDGTRLLTRYQIMELSHSRHPAEEIVRALLAYAGDGDVTSLGNGVNLTLYGSNPVEVSGNVCTVNLASSALQLSRERFYTACLSLASTLCQLSDILHVNVLVADQPVGLDVAGYQPTGAVTAHPGEDLSVLWDQMESRATPLGQNASDVPLSATVTLYFPLVDGGFMPETRNLTFAGQSPAQLAAGLLTAMSVGAQYLTGACSMPDLNALLVSAPESSALSDGSRLITLNFSTDFTNRLSLMGIDPASMMGAIVYTLTTMIPSVSSVRITSGGVTISGVTGETIGSLRFPEGNQRRSHYAAALMEQVTIYLSSGSMLKAANRTVRCSEAEDPRTLLRLLMAGPTDQERAAGLSAPLPAGLDETDVLGIGMRGDTLLLNLSERFGQAVEKQTVGEQLLCYALVTTLCETKSLRRVRFFFAGDAVGYLGGEIYWGGEFLLNRVLIDRTIG